MEKFSDDKGGWQKHVRIYTFSKIYARCLLVNGRAAKPYTPNKTTKKV